MSNCKIIPIVNQKGGVSKTTSVRNLAYSLAELGYRVLVMNYDPQSNLTASLPSIQNPVFQLLLLNLWECLLLTFAAYISSIPCILF